jgi:hypothetical protein
MRNPKEVSASQNTTGAGGVVLVVENLPHNHEALSSSSSTAKIKRKKKTGVKQFTFTQLVEKQGNFLNCLIPQLTVVHMAYDHYHSHLASLCLWGLIFGKLLNI